MHTAPSLFRKSSACLIPDTSAITHSDSYVEVQELGISMSIFPVNNYFPYQRAVSRESPMPLWCELWSHQSGIQESVQGWGDRLAFAKGLRGIFALRQRTFCRGVQLKRPGNLKWTLRFWGRTGICLIKPGGGRGERRGGGPEIIGLTPLTYIPLHELKRNHLKA